ncbi:Protein of unknown function [Pyronema omphalodes CBS 100304]|uniref:Uncharacterized protein n=1 Tax=Pyronema omphalodes (strain CBS 100304) TaxID=1076935 RepID=U4LBL6_PYROM|nr:Protein of unknown function [Pyronema omphalodes CBS 100304]
MDNLISFPVIIRLFSQATSSNEFARKIAHGVYFSVDTGTLHNHSY